MMFLDRSKFQYSNNWFEVVKPVWDFLLPQFNPQKVLEIGSFEGQSTCYLIEKMAELNSTEFSEIHCVDPWLNYVEMTVTHVPNAELIFDANVSMIKSLTGQNISITKHKDLSANVLPRMLAEGKKNYFDLVYVDGAHNAPDVLFDAVMAYELTRPGGVIIFDDYVWFNFTPVENRSVIDYPKIAIDAFTNIYSRKIDIIQAPLYQLYVRKIH
jgi:predicted O-methyltransferase YrrM